MLAIVFVPLAAREAAARKRACSLDLMCVADLIKASVGPTLGHLITAAVWGGESYNWRISWD
jgi:hypothetical protein